MMMLFKGILIGMAGPAPNYDMQRILSTKNPREASMMSAMVNVVLPDALSQFVPAGSAGVDSGGPAGRFHVELRRYSERRAALHCNRPLPEICEPASQRTDLCAFKLRSVVRRGGVGYYLRLVCDLY